MSLLFGVLGLIAISAAIWIRNERHQNLLFIAGGILLLLYSIHIDDRIFIALQSVFVLSAIIELIRNR